MRLRFFLLIAVSSVLFTSCANYGKEYKLDSKHDVYYKGEGVDEAMAKKLAEYLKEQQYFQDDIRASVQLLKVKDTFNINFVVDKSKINDEREKQFVVFGGYISKAVFNSDPVVINLANEHMETIESIGYTPPPAAETTAPAE